MVVSGSTFDKSFVGNDYVNGNIREKLRLEGASLILHIIRLQLLFSVKGDFQLLGSVTTLVACNSSGWLTESSLRSGNQIADFHNGAMRVKVNLCLLTFLATWDIRFQGGQT
ncbi:hypothetical protein AYI68_g2322 [Smittium mucronatum]|uniref:Uncharacterized protein n=1 Tax=Smittium mucronatum TaxID=133383 RepID=A0A1R0H325_9FUNG|nr:hypothetical protein AYI68_g2322 [Smittium mucronatum]